MKELGAPDPVYIQARRALLDVLEALGSHREAVVLVGAQAIYMHVGEAREALSSFTKDADLMLIPALLSDDPAIESALEGAGFSRRNQPGLWFDAGGAEVDLLVPESIAGKGTRAADLGEHHDRLSAMRVAGLEAALVDKQLMEIGAFEQSDVRKLTVAVAGPAALIVAKLHKIGERQEKNASRLQNKDASDLFLLLRETNSEELARTFQLLLSNPQTSPVVQIALRHLAVLFASPNGVGLALLRDAVLGLGEEETTVASCLVLAEELLSQINVP